MQYSGKPGKYILYITVVFGLFFFGCDRESPGQLLSPAGTAKASEAGWEKEYYSNQENYTDTVSSGFGSRVLRITADSMGVSRWYKKIDIKPYTTYKVSGYIKTEGVRGDAEEAGAGFRLGKFPITNDTVFTGNTDWTHVVIQFDSEGEDSFMMEGLLGKNGKAGGSVSFADIRLEEIASRSLHPEVTIHPEQEKAPMSPYLYGQFIEHMGKCIYGGIWAEMLEDRKFYDIPGTSRSPWITDADTTAIMVDSSKTYARGDIPKYKLSNGQWQLSQKNLALKAGKKYVGRLVYRVGKNVKKVEVSIASGAKVVLQSPEPVANGFIKLPFEFQAATDTEEGKLIITFFGGGEVTLAAVSLMPADNIDGFRPDVLELMKELDAPIYRWPGGNFVSGYDWKDGIGDPDARPTKFERAWNGLEYNDVGVHEFMRLCRLLGAEANVAVNTGLGTAAMAAEEVLYFNGDVSTAMGKLRAENGHAEPYNVKLWAVGNEMFGDWQLGHMPVEAYVKKHNEVTEAMWKADPDIELIAVGFPGKWNDMMYEHCSENMTYISEHFYRQDWHAGGLLTHVKQIPDAIREIAEEHRRCREEIPGLRDRDIKIALDEWNYWYGKHVFGLLGTRYYLRDALGIAAGFNEFSRQSDIFYMANYAQTVNVIGAIKTTKTDSWMEGTGLALKMYRKYFGTHPVTLEGTPEPLEVAATWSADGKTLSISVINATRQVYPLKIAVPALTLPDSAREIRLSGRGDMVYNTQEQKDNITISESDIRLNNGTVEVPAESACIYLFALNKE
ncbi:alpha-N-arabinofuranosidase [Sinomicrobium oceani]|uniref:non-reducing end alpha-L-arabinofuranosidase n=1 Tax=Sinomicrobium oceani TaxID=1150368 RepID=A0A1K1PK52_9FLAO|nr:alpha-L-arabinofuranosidase C-terminal domain-containing protein [Sinomicrobium oceani]SFW47996.1 alpha-N-arabinofuranosidase [Sinomicrobium oceani]